MTKYIDIFQIKLNEELQKFSRAAGCCDKNIPV